jgi:hypothetical protein
MANYFDDPVEQPAEGATVDTTSTAATTDDGTDLVGGHPKEGPK